jgi:CMP-N-acetylneuraminic acid synthetase
MKVLAIIPARKGSKRLPGKNKKPLGGVPMISWAINSVNYN